MYLKIFFAVVFIISLVLFVRFITGQDQYNFFGGFFNVDGTVELTDSGNQGGVERQPGTIQSTGGQIFPDTPIVENETSTEISPGFYELTDKEEVFGVYYYEDGGNLTVVLYDENTKSARLEAERFIKQMLPYSEIDLCAMSTTVITNEYVNPRWSGLNLGLSFCAGSVEL